MYYTMHVYDQRLWKIITIHVYRRMPHGDMILSYMRALHVFHALTSINMRVPCLVSLNSLCTMLNEFHIFYYGTIHLVQPLLISKYLSFDCNCFSITIFTSSKNHNIIFFLAFISMAELFPTVTIGSLT